MLRLSSCVVTADAYSGNQLDTLVLQTRILNIKKNWIEKMLIGTPCMCQFLLRPSLNFSPCDIFNEAHYLSKIPNDCGFVS